MSTRRLSSFVLLLLATLAVGPRALAQDLPPATSPPPSFDAPAVVAPPADATAHAESDVTVRTAAGEVHIRNRATATAPPAPSDAAAAQYRAPHAGAVPMLLESNGAPLELSAIVHNEIAPFDAAMLDTPLGALRPRGWTEADELALRRRAADAAARTRYLCTTPCTLFLPPGGTTIAVGGTGRLPADVTLPGSVWPQRFVLHSTPAYRPLLGVLGLVFGVPTLLGGAFFVGDAIASAASPPTPTPAPGSTRMEPPSPGDIGMMVCAGIVLVGFGLWGTVGGIVALANSRTGIASAGPSQGIVVGARAGPSRGGLARIGFGVAPTSGRGWSAGLRVAF